MVPSGVHEQLAMLVVPPPQIGRTANRDPAVHRRPDINGQHKRSVPKIRLSDPAILRSVSRRTGRAAVKRECRAVFSRHSHTHWIQPTPSRKGVQTQGDSAIPTTIQVLRRVRIFRCWKPRLRSKPCHLRPSRQVDKSRSLLDSGIRPTGVSRGISDIVGCWNRGPRDRRAGALETVGRARQASLIFRI